MSEEPTVETSIIRDHLTKELSMPTLEYEHKEGDLENQFTDITFKNEDKSVRLKQLLPGDYTVVVIRDGVPRPNEDAGSFDHNSRTVNIRTYMFEGGENSLGFLAALLHESGHAAEFLSGDPVTSRVRAETDLTTAQLNLAVRYGNNNYQMKDEDVEHYRKYLTSWMEYRKAPEDIVTQILEQYGQVVDKIKTIKTDESYEDAKQQYRKDCDIAGLYRDRMEERIAWNYAIRAARELKKLGIADFGNMDLINFANESLKTYDAGAVEVWKCLRPDEEVPIKLNRATNV